MTLNLAMVATFDTTDMVRGANEGAEALRRIQAQQEVTHRSLQENIDRGLRSGSGTTQADVDAYGRELDQLRARFNPLFAAQQQYRSELTAIRQAHRVGAIDQNEMAAAIARTKAAFASHVTGMRAGAGATGQMAQSSKLAAHEITNLSFQVNDIAVMLASGQSPFLIAAQQGMQVSQIMGRRGLTSVIGGVVQGLGSLVTPTTIALVGITALGYGASAVFGAMQSDIEDTDAVLDRHGDVVADLRDAYDEASSGARSYARDSQAAFEVARFQAEQQAEALAAAVRRGLLQARSEIDAFEFFSNEDGSEQTSRLRAEFEPFADVIARLASESRQASPDVDGLRADIIAVMDASDDNSVEELGDDLLALTDTAAQAAASLREIQGDLYDTDTAMRQLISSAGVFATAMDDLGSIAPVRLDPRQQAGEIYDRAIGQATTMGQIASINAAYESALDRIAEDEAEDAKHEAERAARKAASAARRSARSAASEANRAARELDRRTVAQAEYLKLLADSRAQIEMELLMIGAPTLAREQALAVMDAENKMRELGIDLTSDQADFYRGEAAALAELRLQQEAAAQGFDLIKNTGSRMIDEVFDRLADRDPVGALEAITSALLDLAKTLFVTNPLQNMLYGMNAPTGANLGGGLGILNMLFGGLFGGGGGVSNAGLAAVASGAGGLFDRGGATARGWTGFGGVNEAVGITHGQEFTVRAPFAARYRPQLERMNRGQYRNFDQGGWSGGGSARTESSGSSRPLTVNVIDNAGVNKSQERRDDGNGGDVLDIVLETVDAGMADGRFDTSMGRYGQKAVGVVR